MKTNKIAAASLLTCLIMMAFPLQADMLNIGASVYPTTPNTSGFAGTLIAGNTVTLGGAVAGLVEERVYNNNGFLDFYWRITATSNTIDGLLLGNFADTNFTYDANWLSDASSDVAPDLFYRSPSYPKDVNVGFFNGVQAGQSSTWFYLQTNATSYDSNAILGLSNGSAYSATITTAYGPSAVPVPAAAWLLGSGLIMLAGYARKRKTA